MASATTSRPTLRPVTAWLFENPWPLATILGIGAAIALWRALTGGGRRDLAAAGMAVALGAAVVLSSFLVTTPAEHGRSVVERLVDRAVATDVEGALACFTESAVLNYGARENPSEPIAEIGRALGSLRTRNRIDSNRITRLDGVTIDATTAEVEFSCSTGIRGSESAIPTSWIARVRKTPDGWRVDRLTFERMFGKPPMPRGWW